MGAEGTIDSGMSLRARAERSAILAPLVLLLAALAFRAIDIFVLRLDERLGEIILSKALGFVIVVVFTWWVGKRLADLGLHRRNYLHALAIGGGFTVAAFVIAGVAQALTMTPGDKLVVAAVDPKTGMAGGAAFAAFLILGNVVNSFMEEGLFRGIMLPHFLRKMRFVWANLLQAALFAAWHLVWPLKAYLDGDVSAGGALARGGLLLLGTFVSGLIYGYLFWRTDSLWTPWIAHFINNTTLNLLQVQTASGEIQPAMLMSIVAVVALAFLVFMLGPIARRLDLPRLQSWRPMEPEVAAASAA